MSVKTKRAVWLGSAISIAFVGFAAFSTAAWSADEKKDEPAAQAQPTPTAPPAAPAPAAEDKKVERVVVTGSRIKRSEFTSSSPVQIITKEETTLEGLTDTADILQGSSVAAGSAQINNTLTGFTGFDGGPGANTVSLRGLGANRTLVLINGRRMGPAGARGQIGPVDLNTISETIIDRIEILKDGGSSVYGSDAVAGVVNVITIKNTDGIVLTGNATVPFEDGGASYQVGGYYAQTFDKGNFLISGEYYRREPLELGDRDYLSCAQDLVSLDGPSGRLLDIIDPATGQSKCFNISVVGAASRLIGGTFVPDASNPGGGGFMPPVAGVTAGFPDLPGFRRVGHTFANANTYINAICALSAVPPGYCANTTTQNGEKERLFRLSQGVAPRDDVRLDSKTIVSPVERMSFFGQGAYDVMPGVEAYTELMFARRESEQRSWRQFFPDICGAAATSLPNGIPCTGSNASNPFGTTTEPVILLPSNQSQTIDFYRALLGLRGDFSDRMPIFGGWSYDAYAQHTRSEADYTGTFIYNDRVNATVAVGCNQARITISGGLCSSLPAAGVNWFAPNTLVNSAFSPAEAAFLFSSETGHTTYSQTIMNASVTGDIFQLPYGALSGAFGVEYREDEIDDTPGPMARANNYWGSTSAGRTAGSDRVREAFGELQIPLLSGLSLAEDLSVNASARYTSYDSYGEDSTYKLGVNWQITPEYRLRGTTGTSFRAPALYEIFLANQTGFLSQASIDPCVNWDSSTVPGIAASCGPAGLNLPPGFLGAGSSATIFSGGGGPGVLNAERSEARTVGFIWTPEWIDFSAALDYWEMEVNGEVAQFGSANILGACHTKLPFGSSPFCTLFSRDLSGTPATNPNYGHINDVHDSFVNLDSQISDGLDLTVRYEHEFSFGKFRFDGQMTWTFSDEINFLASGAFDDFNGELYEPDFVANLNARFDYEDWTFFWAADLLSRSSNDEEFGGSIFGWRSVTPYNGHAYYKQYAEFYASHDFSVRYRADDWSIVAGVQNIFDEPPPSISTTGGFGKIGNAAVVTGNYDIVGRSGFLTVTKEF